jgi:hypothetical protein
MTWIGDNPIAVFAPALAIIFLLVVAYFRTGRKLLLAVAGLIIAAIVGLLIVESQVVTEREKVEATLREIASFVEQNRIREALEYAASNAPFVRGRAEQELSRYEFGEVDIKQNLEIEVSEDQEPKRAVARFNATVLLKKDPTGFATNRRIPRYVEVELIKEGDQWKVLNYSHREPTFGLKKREERMLPGSEDQ